LLSVKTQNRRNRRAAAGSSGRHYAPCLVAITGGSGSGKTWLAERLQAALGPRAVRLSLDSFYHDRSHLTPARRARLNFDHPAAVSWGEAEAALKDLLAGRTTRIPDYDFKRHCRTNRARLVRPRPIILMDGLWLLRRRSLRRLLTLSIFVDCPTHLRLRRRLERDLRGRGRSATSVREQFRVTVEPMHRRYVAPQKYKADVVLRPPWGRRQLREILARLSSIERRNLSGSPSRSTR
jgi:uridine kinase